MEWIVKITDKPNQRIVVRFVPKDELVCFIGQYKPHNGSWIDFTEETHPMDIDLNQIQNMLFICFDIMNKRLDAYTNISDGFKVIKEIEIKEI